MEELGGNGEMWKSCQGGGREMARGVSALKRVGRQGAAKHRNCIWRGGNEGLGEDGTGKDGAKGRENNQEALNEGEDDTDEGL